MDWYDGLMIGIIILSALHGAWKGMAWQVAPIVSIVLGYVVAYPLSAQYAPWFGEHAPTNRFVALLAIYVGIALAVHLVIRIFHGVIESMKMVNFDRHVGVLLGAVKGCLICLLITFFFVSLSPKGRDHVLQTKSGYAAGYVMRQIEPVLPGEVHDFLEPYLASWNDQSTPSKVVPAFSKASETSDTNDRPKLSQLWDRISTPNQSESPTKKNTSTTKSASASASAFVDEIIQMVDKREKTKDSR